MLLKKVNYCFLKVSDGLWVVDITKKAARKVDSYDGILTLVPTKDTPVLFSHSKDMLFEAGLEKHFLYNQTYCLKTAKDILSLNFPSDEVLIPTFNNSQEVLAWCQKTLVKTCELLQKAQNVKLYELECQVVFPLIFMERLGMPFCQKTWQNHVSELMLEQEGLKASLTLKLSDGGFGIFKDTLNLNNHQEVKKRLEKALDLKLPDLSSETLEGLPGVLGKNLATYQKNHKMLSLYGEDFISTIKNNRIFGTFLVRGSVSGRLACRNMNLQALPQNSFFRKAIKNGVKKHHTLQAFDYEAFELKILAHLSNDEHMLKIFQDNKDIHALVAHKVFGQEVSKSKNPHLRAMAKIINFAIIYGMSTKSLAKKLGVKEHDAVNFTKSYFKAFPKVWEFLQSSTLKAQNQGYVTTALHKKVAMTHNVHTRSKNIPIQGTGGEIMKQALVLLFVKESSLRVVNTIHDEVVLELTLKDVKKAQETVPKVMNQAFKAILGGA